ncbi:hypothetical protein DICSQDRAFT_165023 [Dichomitus squalens LYAD-421 SS1]|uniref:uncharacterized protein n=1 Tax=Dichomitus squalens (strain LYAD-421) TaxID=732165 RepID=UPI0004412B0B|nr:uncharacterized protein DICSQDRAFT_165023 [Dichomitus squalens LYAD-421 SS1]EJF67191.1 hypothetical protein DICSQDRAFT_165023 [Dichomitus squalens LYAD-421 SS1]
MATPHVKVVFEVMMCGVKTQTTMSFDTIENVLQYIGQSTPLPSIIGLDLPMTPQDFLDIDRYLCTSKGTLRELRLDMDVPVPGQYPCHRRQPVNAHSYPALVSLSVHGFVPTTLDSSFIHLTHLTLGDVYSQTPPLWRDQFLDAMKTWTSLKVLEIEEYNKMIQVPESSRLVTLPRLEILKIKDSPHWASCILPCLDLPGLRQLHTHRTFADLPWGGNMLFWVPPLGNAVTRLLHMIKGVHIEVAQDVYQPTTISTTGPDDRRVVLTASVMAPMTRWHQWQLEVLPSIMLAMANVFPQAATFNITGDFATMGKKTWTGFLKTYPELLELHIRDIGHRDGRPLFLALDQSELGPDDRVLCPSLKYISMYGVAQSRELLQEMHNALLCRSDHNLVLDHLDLYPQILAEPDSDDLLEELRSDIEDAVAVFEYKALNSY